MDLLVAQAAESNRIAGITGVLLYDGGNFLQILEGEPATVDALFARICQDTRHHHVKLIERVGIEQRNFADWSMAARRLAEGNWNNLNDRLLLASGLGYEVVREFWSASPGRGQPALAGRGGEGENTLAAVRRILVVDDTQSARLFLRSLLSNEYDVITASCGEEALQLLGQFLPDAVLLDVEMPGMNGYEVCRKLLQMAAMPIIFVTANDTQEAHLAAFEAGGVDVLTKPVAVNLLRRKLDLAIRSHQREAQLSREKHQLHAMAMSFLSSMGHSGVLLNFLRSSLQCRSYEQLAAGLCAASDELGVPVFGVIRSQEKDFHFSSAGSITEFERSVLDGLNQLGRVFQFRRQLVVNFPHVTLVTNQLPIHDPTAEGRARDDLAVLAEVAEALCDNVAMRQESMQRAEQLQVALGGAISAVDNLRHKHDAVLMDTRLLLEELSSEVEGSFSWLGVSNDQERALSAMLGRGIDRIIHHLTNNGRFDADFDQVVETLRGRPDDGDRVELF